jgi:hypothetical protein
MKDLKNVVELMKEKKALEKELKGEKWSDRDRIYREVRIETLTDQADDEAKKISDGQISHHILVSLAEDIAVDFDDQTIDRVDFMSRDEYIQNYLTHNMDDDRLRLFEEMYDAMSEENKRNWLDSNYFSESAHYYTDSKINFILSVHIDYYI